MLLNNTLFCKVICIFIFKIYAIQAASLRCYRNSIKDYMELPLKESSNMVNTSYIKLNQELDIVIHGYQAEINEYIENIIAKLIMAFGDTKSYCALDWKNEASAYIGGITKPIANFFGVKFLGFDYFAVSIIASGVGDNLGEALIDMANHGLNIEAAYLIGHSEGAHLAGQAGRKCQTSGKTLARITGLDPAKLTIGKRLDKTCAKLVDGVHTDHGLYGTASSVGDIDFWPNDDCRVQPGCEYNSLLRFLDICSHRRALLLMADAIEYPDSLQGASKVKNTVSTEGCSGPPNINFIGFNIIPCNLGSFYLCTNATSEYGRGPEGTCPANCTCACSST